jgi:hypothetical protein
MKYIMGKSSKKRTLNTRRRRKGGFFNIFSRGKAVSKKSAKTKRVKVSTNIIQTGSFNNEQDCLSELKNPENKGGKCTLTGYGSYSVEKEVPVYSR